RPANPLTEQAADLGRHLLPALDRSQSSCDVRPSKPHGQLRVLNQRLCIPESNPFQRAPPKECVRSGECDEEPQRILSIVGQPIHEILVRGQPRHDALTQIQDPVVTMHRSSLRIVEVSESLRHSQRLGNIVSIKRRNYLPLGLVEGIVERVALPETRVAVKDFDPWISLGISSTDLQGPVYRLILDNDHLQVLSRIFQTDSDSSSLPITFSSFFTGTRTDTFGGSQS